MRKKGPPTAEQIARKADRGDNVSRYFTNRGRMMSPIQRVNVDFTVEMLSELDEAARVLHVSRQAVIKSLIRQGLDRRYLAERARRAPEG
ncbi:MAG: type II toxin-antitoxin system BrnA family antitoxin [Vicinamibacteria bacterium]